MNPESTQRRTRRNRLTDVVDNTVAVVRKHRPDYSILTYTTILVMIGLIIIFAIGPQRANLLNMAYGSDVSDAHFIIKQLVSVGLAVGAFILTAVIVPFKYIQRYAKYVLYAGLALCGVLYIGGNILHIDQIAVNTLGAYRWINIPGGSLQPSEILKLGMLLFVAGFLAVRMKKGYMNDINKTLIPLAVILGLCEFIVVVLQKDLGTGISLLAIVVSMVVATNIQMKKLGYMFAGILAIGALAIIVAPHRVERVMTFLQGDEINLSDPSAYHIAHAKIAIGSGGVMGVGIGNSVQAAGYLPEAINDSVFAILGETFGFFGLVFILVMFYLLLVRMLNIANALPDIQQRLIVIGVFGWIFSHVIINIGAMTGLIPLTGITLPFLSFGGTSILIIALALGVVFQLSRYTVHQSQGKETSNENLSSRRRVGRTRYTSRRGSF